MSPSMYAPKTPMEPAWMVAARKYLGTREVPGPATSGVLAAFLKRLHAWWGDDETPWCAVFVSAILQEVGIPYPKAFYRAAAFLEWGRPLTAHDRHPAARPPYGAIAVLPRKGGNHVGLVVDFGFLAGVAHVWLLGGNQNNRVCVMPFPLSQVSAFRWPELPYGLTPPTFQPDSRLKAILAAHTYARPGSAS